MRNLFTISLILALSFIFTGCNKKVEPPLYTWGNYVESSASYGMYGERKEVLEKHLLELEKIINESEEKDKRVAPGIYAEYGQILYETNKRKKAKKYFYLEKNTYQEASVFIDRILKKLYGSEL